MATSFPVWQQVQCPSCKGTGRRGGPDDLRACGHAFFVKDGTAYGRSYPCQGGTILVDVAKEYLCVVSDGTGILDSSRASPWTFGSSQNEKLHTVGTRFLLKAQSARVATVMEVLSVSDDSLDWETKCSKPFHCAKEKNGKRDRSAFCPHCTQVVRKKLTFCPA